MSTFQSPPGYEQKGTGLLSSSLLCQNNRHSIPNQRNIQSGYSHSQSSHHHNHHNNVKTHSNISPQKKQARKKRRKKAKLQPGRPNNFHSHQQLQNNPSAKQRQQHQQHPLPNSSSHSQQHLQQRNNDHMNNDMPPSYNDAVHGSACNHNSTLVLSSASASPQPPSQPPQPQVCREKPYSFDMFMCKPFEEWRSIGIAKIKAQEQMSSTRLQPKYSSSTSQLNVAPLMSSSSSSSSATSYVELTDLPMDRVYVIDRHHSLVSSSSSESSTPLDYRDMNGNIIRDWKLFMDEVHKGEFHTCETLVHSRFDPDVLQNSYAISRTNIIRNQLCCVYTGQYDIPTDTTNYTNINPHSRFFYHYITDAKILGKNIRIQPSCVTRNVSYCIQDYRHQNGIINIPINGDDYENDNEPNVRFIEILYNCMIYVFIIANCDISRDQVLYIDYGREKFWRQFDNEPKDSLIQQTKKRNIISIINENENHNSGHEQKKQKSTISSKLNENKINDNAKHIQTLRNNNTHQQQQQQNDDGDKAPYSPITTHLKKKSRSSLYYEVSKIDDVSLDRSTGELLYQTFWVGYEQPTFEPAKSFIESKELLHGFQEKYFASCKTKMSRGLRFSPVEELFYRTFKDIFGCTNTLHKKQVKS